MVRLVFEVASSRPDETYQVVVTKNGPKLECSCECNAGQMKSFCKHRSAVFATDTKLVVAGDLESLAKVPELLVGTDVATLLMEIDIKEQQAKRLKSEITKAKKTLGKLLG